MTPDWAEKPTEVPYAHFGNPQSLNLYSYVENNPTTFGDPDGHVPWGYGGWGECTAGPESCGSPSAQTNNAQAANILQGAQNQGHPGDGCAIARYICSGPGGLVLTPRDMPDGGGGILAQLVGKLFDLLGITFVTPPHGDTLSEDPSIPIPVPKTLLWIEKIVNGHGWDEHGEEDFGSKEDFKRAILDTVENAKGRDVQHPDKFRTLFWNDKEGFAVWQNKKYPDRSTAYFPDDPNEFKKQWGLE